MLRDKPKPEDRNSLRTPFPLNLKPTRISFCQHNGKQFIIVSLTCSPNTLTQNCFHNLKSKLYTTETSNCKGIETLAVFPVNSDIVIVNTHLPPFPLINVVMDLVMIFKVTSNSLGARIQNTKRKSKISSKQNQAVILSNSSSVSSNA